MTDEAKLPTIDQAAKELQPFFDHNPDSSVEQPNPAEPTLRIVKPWGDTSLALEVKRDFFILAQCLNQVVLPKRLSAVWHKDSSKLEVIWTALDLPEDQKELADRSFTFKHDGHDHLCKFGESSERLRIIASHVRPLTISDTNFRNLQSFHIYEVSQRKGKPPSSVDCPRSFWICDLEWDELKVIDLLNHLNFYMRYYDFLTPTVLVHEPEIKESPSNKTRYIKGEFPAAIESNRLDENLLSFWHFSDDGNPMLRFLLYYRIIEYAAVHYIGDSIRTELRKLIISPDLRSDINKSVERMVGAMNVSSLSDSQRLDAVVKASVDAKLLWKEVKDNFAFFSKDTRFEGGFSVSSLIGNNETESTFAKHGLEAFSARIRKIRNALSHGKDQETAGVIRPTPANLAMFVPWVHLIATASAEVVLYRNVT